ncbi:MAG: UDP binding domain-containing protein, partial [Niveispirillum sp.]|uniref:UDP binding domain-containing protein n=1 Tax=Niveispirillum sp. TaxID=1917217 RepID=UPI003BA5A934
EAAKMLQGVQWAEDAYGALAGADCALILTEWNEFRMLNLSRVCKSMKAPVLVDLRNIFNAEDAEMAGFAYHCVGRPGRVKKAKGEAH